MTISTQNSLPLGEEKKLLELLQQDESPVLDFKREVHHIDHENSQIRKQAIDELIKDLIALANGNAIFAGETAYLIFGAEDKKDQHGIRALFDVGEHGLTASRILDLVNAACEPKIENIACDEYVIEGKKLLWVTIFPTPYLHETTRRIQPKPDKIFTERTAFIRREQSIGIASQRERETIAQIKRFRFSEKRNPPGIPFGVLVGGFIGGTLAHGFIKNQDKIKEIPNINAAAGITGAIFGATIGGTEYRIYKDIYEIRSGWHKVPSHLRIPILAGSFGIVVIAFRALGYIYSRFPSTQKK